MFVHYMTIGVFEPFNPTPPIHRRDLVVRRPFERDDLDRIEEEVLRRYDRLVDLDRYVTPDGALRIPYLSDAGFESFAEHVALVAHELFGAVAAERLRDVFSPEYLRKAVDDMTARDAERNRIKDIESGAARIDAIVENLNTHRDPVRLNVAFALDAVDRTQPDAIPRLVALTRDSDWEIRLFAACALGRFGSAAEVAVPSLVHALSDPWSSVRWGAVEALGRIGARAVPALIQALSHDDSHVRWCAVVKLGELGPEASAALPLLEEIIGQDDLEMRRAAKRAVRRIRRG